MKTKLLLFTLTLIPALCVLSQVPQGFNYQAIARDGNGDPITGATIKVRLSVLSDTNGFYGGTGGTYIWEEEHTGVKTNAFGLFTIAMGSPSATKIQGAPATFSAIDWSPANLFIGTKIANPTTYKVLGSAKIWSVPYSLRAKDTETKQNLSITGTNLTISNGNTVSLTSATNQWSTDGTNIYRTTGNVGIGTSSPSGKLNSYLTLGDAVNNTAELLSLTAKPASNTEHLRFYGIRKIAGNDWQNVAFRIQHRVESTDMAYIEFNPGTMGRDLAFGTNNLERMRINIDGNVGIGTTSPSSKMVIQPPANWDDNLPLFEVKNKYGYSVLAVYNNGVRILVEDSDGKGTKGGFAIGGFDQTKAGETFNLMTVSTDSIRFTIDNNPAKAGTKGGFAIGGLDGSKAVKSKEFMYVTPQASDDGQYNTFMGYQAGKSNLSTGAFNSFIGYMAGYSNTSGVNNVFVGYQSGYKNTKGVSNAFFGNLSGYNNTTGKRNTYLGHKAGYAYLNGSSGSSNVFIGDSTGYVNSTGARNVFIGSRTGPTNLNGYNNVFIGNEAGYNNQGGYSNTYIGTEAGHNAYVGYDNVYIGYRTGYAGHGQYNVMVGHESGLANNGGSLNTFVGKSAGKSNVDGDYNTFIGIESGLGNTSGNYNIAIGRGAGSGNQTGASNIFIGNDAGYTETGSNTLYIGSNPLIYGVFNTMVVIKGKNNPSSKTFFVNGTAGGTSEWAAESDMRLKTNIRSIPDALERICRMKGVEFEWIDKTDREKDKQIGFLGQELMEILPEVVDNNNDHYSVQYGSITSILVEAVKEQQKIIENSRQENVQLRSELESLKERMQAIEAALGKK